ncbi:hypothetical protein [Ammoniphilus sp. 3BR4]|uniref:hypothetical protein n=1 Tax=Ammoniphilus sp. 3BR4 TaxID=3158265 RepID=UPI003467CA83
MSKKIENILDKAVPKLIDKKRELSLFDIYVIEAELDKELDDVVKKLKNCNMRELTKVKEKINDQLINLMREYIDSNGKNEELVSYQENLDMQQKVISKTIETKQLYQKQFTHPVEKNVFRHGLFRSSTPNETTLQRIRTDKGIIEEVRNGFRKLYYRNENGYYLTTYDSKVFIGLLKLWEMKGKERAFHFQFKELLKVIESDLAGGEYNLLSKSLDNLARTSIIMEEYLDATSGKKTRTRIHHPIQNADIIYTSGTAEAHIEFNNYLHDSLLAGNYVLINMGLFNDLATPTSKNLYLYIVNELSEHERNILIDPLIEHLGIVASTRTKAVNMIKEAFAELKDFDVIKDYDVIKAGRFYKEFTFVPSDWLKNQPIIIEERSNITFLGQQ